MRPADTDDIRDDDLSGAFLDAPFPPTPRFVPWELVKAHRRRLFRRGSFAGGLLAVGASFSFFFWSMNSWTDRASEVAQAPLPAVSPLEMAELEVLFATPPVDALDQLGQQQAAFLLAIRQSEME
jgi:hypothetical protein